MFLELFEIIRVNKNNVLVVLVCCSVIIDCINTRGLYPRIPVLASEGSSRSFLRHFPVRYFNSDNTKRNLAEFYTKAMLRFLIFEEFLKKYCGWKFGGAIGTFAPPQIRNAMF